MDGILVKRVKLDFLVANDVRIWSAPILNLIQKVAGCVVQYYYSTLRWLELNQRPLTKLTWTPHSNTPLQSLLCDRESWCGNISPALQQSHPQRCSGRSHLAHPNCACRHQPDCTLTGDHVGMCPINTTCGRDLSQQRTYLFCSAVELQPLNLLLRTCQWPQDAML